MTRVDLHLHSRASTDTGSWFLRQAALPESYTSPTAAYAAAKRRGMDFVTISDHNTLDGVLEIAHHRDVFMSVEVTTLFPEDRTPLHVLVWGLDEAQWAEIDRVRANVYDLVTLLDAQGLVHALAHPLQRLGDLLTADHVERCLLLFPIWEGRNGARTRAGNEIGVRIAASASREYLAKLSEKHGIAARADGPPSLTAGSDDHGLLDVAATWTETPAASTVAELLDHIRAGRTTPKGAHGSTDSLAHAMVSLGLKGYAQGGAPGIPEAIRGLVGDLFAHSLPPQQDSSAEAGELGREMMSRLRGDRRVAKAFRRAGRMPEGAERAHARLRLAIGWAHAQLAGMAIRDGANPFGGPLAGRLDRLAAAAGLAAPYLLAAGYHASERRFAHQIGAQFFGETPPDWSPARVALLTDTYREVNGAAGTLRRLVEHCRETGDGRLTVVTAGEPCDEPELVSLPPLARIPVPAYADPGWKLGIPPIIDLLQLIESRNIEVVHAATPGPMGLAGLLIARILGLPFVASYHTELARYAMDLTGDRLAAEITRSAVTWFYSQAERVYVPSRTSAAGLIEQGISASRLHLMTRGADTVLFSPERRARSMRRRLAGDDATILIYVGRISREKGLGLLADAFRKLAATRPDLALVIVGDGPGRAELQDALLGTRHHFAGVLRGTELATAYASADVFCLPSSTETFGQVLIEAAASGLPSVVVGNGAAAEVVRDGETGLVARGATADDLAASLARVVDDAGMRATLGTAARRAIRGWPTWTEVFAGLRASYSDLRDPSGVRTMPMPPSYGSDGVRAWQLA
jgi:glycosyltransferase involved in cell wall biosynthesis/predicted metal-dependent phosphoesterase TrpH